MTRTRGREVPHRPIPEGLPPDFVAAMIRLASHDRIELMIETQDAFFMMAALQLALRHPTFPSRLRVHVDRIAHRLVDLISELEPELRFYAEAGFDRSQDVPSTRQSQIDE